MNRAHLCVLRGRTRQSELLCRVLPCELMGRARQGELQGGARLFEVQ